MRFWAITKELHGAILRNIQKMRTQHVVLARCPERYPDQLAPQLDPTLTDTDCLSRKENAIISSVGWPTRNFKQ